MTIMQADLFAQDATERNSLSESRRSVIRARLEAVLSKLEASSSFPWNDPLDATHEENRFEDDAELLGEEGKMLWVRFDRQMSRLYAEHADFATRGE
jgi:hypothetical protein